MNTGISKYPTPVIHIGMPKTATKTLQWRLFAEHREIYYLGRFDGPQFRESYRKFNACRDQIVKEVMEEIAYTNIAKPDFEKCDRLLEMALRPAVEKDLVPVWSWESYSTDILVKRRQRARNLKRAFGEAKILITIRHPVGLLESAFLQRLRRDNVGQGARFNRPVFLCSMDDWMRAEWDRDVRHHLEYPETIRAYVDQFGLSHVNVLLFEELCSDSRSFFRKVCGVLGVSEEEGLKLVWDKRDNSRWTQHQIEKLEEIKRSPFRSFGFRFAKRKKRCAMLGLDPSGAPQRPGPGARPAMSEKWLEEILSMTRDGNRWLSQVFDIPLEKYGYFSG